MAHLSSSNIFSECSHTHTIMTMIKFHYNFTSALSLFQRHVFSDPHKPHYWGKRRQLIGWQSLSSQRSFNAHFFKFSPINNASKEQKLRPSMCCRIICASTQKPEIQLTLVCILAPWHWTAHVQFWAEEKSILSSYLLCTTAKVIRLIPKLRCENGISAQLNTRRYIHAAHKLPSYFHLDIISLPHVSNFFNQKMRLRELMRFFCHVWACSKGKGTLRSFSRSSQLPQTIHCGG